MHLQATTTGTMAPFTTQQIATIGGTVVTSFVTITPTATATSAADGAVTKTKLSSGSVIAIAVASVVAAIVLLAAIVVGFCCWKRKKEREYTPETPEAFVNRPASGLSKIGWTGGTKTSSNSNAGESIFPVAERHGSRPMVFDQRLNPNAIMHHDDRSNTSFLSMEDNRDYTRTLNVSACSGDV
jgi:cell wall integrity and stress response component